MTANIAFTDVDYSSDGYIRCGVSRQETSNLWIKLPYEARVNTDLIALALSTLCGTSFDEISFDLPIGPETKRKIETHTHATLKSPTGKDKSYRPGTDTALNFSGGFDSLAAMSILKNPHLISLDFGGRFAREKQFFQAYQPYIIETNITELGLNRNSWQFMGIGSILLKDELRLKHYAFGSIMAGSLNRLLAGPLDQYNSGLWAANEVGMRRINPVSGVTEIGTLNILLSQHYHVIVDSLKSLANPREDKFLRKWQMLTAVVEARGYPVRLPEPATRKSKRKWGESKATDLSSIYVMSKLGPDEVAETYSGGIPNAIRVALPRLDLDFFNRVNPHAYHNIPDQLRGRFLKRLAEFGLHPYERKDWAAAEKVAELLELPA
ncbi:hypothetical protein [Brevibacterium casei]|uniref:hypothetical protein n=1 Tax=Brevibacterium casei TaxID=33889 RepID=UPI003EB76002